MKYSSVKAVHILFTDGTEETQRANMISEKVGVLHLSIEGYGGMGFYEEDKGSYPLVNIKRWRIADE